MNGTCEAKEGRCVIPGEEEIRTGIERGDVSALGDLYGMHAGALHAYAVSILRNEAQAEDAVSESFVRLYRHAAAGKGIRNAKALLFTICRNLAFDMLGRAGSRYEPLSEEIAGVTPGEDDAVAVRQALGRLEDGERDIVTLYCMGGFKHREIAAMLGMPEGTVRWKYRSALGKLKRELGGADDE